MKEETDINNPYKQFDFDNKEDISKKNESIPPYTVENLVNDTKGTLKFQKLIFWGFCFSQAMLGLVAVSLIFFFYSVDFTCLTKTDGIVLKKLIYYIES